MKFEKIDLEVLEKKGISREKLIEQLEMIRDGFPWLKIEAPATASAC